MRERKFDLLRIVAMLMIICHHCVVNDFGLQKELIENTMGLTMGQIIIYSFINSLVVIGVNLFFLLSGYFSIHFSWKKIVSIVLKVYIVFGIVTCLGIITNNVPLNLGTIKRLLDPLDTYWYMMTYLLLMCVSPLLNIIIENITKKQFCCFFIGVMLICCGYGFLLDLNLHINRGYSFLMAMVLYLTGAGIRKFDMEKIGNKGGAIFF